MAHRGNAARAAAGKRREQAKRNKQNRAMMKTLKPIGKGMTGALVGMCKYFGILMCKMMEWTFKGMWYILKWSVLAVVGLFKIAHKPPDTSKSSGNVTAKLSNGDRVVGDVTIETEGDRYSYHPDPPRPGEYARGWDFWAADLHTELKQVERIERAVVQDITIVPDLTRKPGTVSIRGTSGEIYDVSLGACSCMDYMRQRKPCKHMYRLAIERGLVEPDAYIIRSGAMPHPLRGYMNFGRFEVRGIKADSGRKSKRTIVAPSQDEAIAIAERKGEILPPYDIQEVPFLAPTDSQLEKAVSLKAYIPAGAVREDVAAAIERAKSGQATIGATELADATDKQIMISALSSYSAYNEACRKRAEEDRVLARIQRTRGLPAN